MNARTFAVGDIHGELDQLMRLLGRLPALAAEDTLLFIGDYVDRGPDSAGVVRFLADELPHQTEARIVTLRGNHEASWLRVRDAGWPEYVLNARNGCLATRNSFRGCPEAGYPDSLEEMDLYTSGAFFPPEVLDWMRRMPFYHEDEHALYVHGGLPTLDGGWRHPSGYEDQTALAWSRDQAFFTSYRGKRVVFGHTPAAYLPQHLSTFTPEDARDLYVAGDVVGIDTGCGRGGFLSALELPAMKVHETRGSESIR